MALCTQRCANCTIPQYWYKYHSSEDAHLTCSTGAGHYKVVYGDTGSGIKQSVSSRHKDGINIGPPNSSVQPMDTFGMLLLMTTIHCYVMVQVLRPLDQITGQILHIGEEDPSITLVSV